MKKQERIGKRQVESLIGSTLDGYNGILALNGKHYEVVNEGGLVKAVSKITVNNAGTLSKIVNNLIGMTLYTNIPEKDVVVKSNIYNESTSKEDITAFLASYENKLDQTGKEINNLIAMERKLKRKKVADFQEAMLELQELYKFGNIQKVADAIEKVSSVAAWGTKVSVKPLYDGAKALQNVAKFNWNKGFEEALGPYLKLYGALNRAKVANVWFTIGNKDVVGSRVNEPDKTQVYTGKIDHELIAKDIVKNH